MIQGNTSLAHLQTLSKYILISWEGRIKQILKINPACYLIVNSITYERSTRAGIFLFLVFGFWFTTDHLWQQA